MSVANFGSCLPQSDVSLTISTWPTSILSLDIDASGPHQVVNRYFTIPKAKGIKRKCNGFKSFVQLEWQDDQSTRIYGPTFWKKILKRRSREEQISDRLILLRRPDGLCFSRSRDFFKNRWGFLPFASEIHFRSEPVHDNKPCGH